MDDRAACAGGMDDGRPLWDPGRTSLVPGPQRSAPVPDTITPIADAMQTVLDDIPELHARATGFLRRQRKLTAAVFVKTLVFGWLANPKASLDELARVAALL